MDDYIIIEDDIIVQVSSNGTISSLTVTPLFIGDYLSILQVCRLNPDITFVYTPETNSIVNKINVGTYNSVNVAKINSIVCNSNTTYADRVQSITLKNGDDITSKTKLIIKQDALTETVSSTTYGAITINSASYPEADACVSDQSAKIYVSPTVTYSQTKTITYSSGRTETEAVTSGGTVTYSRTSGSGTVHTSSGLITWNHNHTASRVSTGVTVKVTLNGKTATKAVTAYLKAGDITTTYGNVYCYISYPTKAEASGGTVGPNLFNVYLPVTNKSSICGASTSSTLDVTSQSSITCSIVSGSGASVSDTGRVSWSANTGTSERSVSVRMTSVYNGTTCTNTDTCTQKAAEVTTPETPTITKTEYYQLQASISYSNDSIAYNSTSHGTPTVSVEYKRKYTWSDGDITYDTTWTTCTASASKSYSSGNSNLTVNSSNGSASWSGNNTTGSDRSATITLTATYQGLTATASDTVTLKKQAAKVISSYTVTWPSLSYSSTSKDGGTANPSWSSSISSISYKITYTDGTSETKTGSGTASGWSCTGTGASIDTSGVVTWTANTTTSSRSASVSCTLSISSISQSTSRSATASQEKADPITVTSTEYQIVSTPSLSYGTAAYTGGTLSPTFSPALSATKYQQRDVYSDGSKGSWVDKTGTGTASGWSCSGTGASVNSSGTVTWAANSGAARSASVSCTVTIQGKTCTPSGTANQNAAPAPQYRVSAASISYSGTISRSGGSGTPSISYTIQQSTDGGSTWSNVSKTATVSVTASGTGCSISNSTTGAFTFSSNGNGEEVKAARSATLSLTVTYEGSSKTASCTVNQAGTQSGRLRFNATINVSGVSASGYMFYSSGINNGSSWAATGNHIIYVDTNANVSGSVGPMTGNPYSNVSGVSVSQSGADVTVSYTVNN